jgi:branched-chain amino acid transport system substrate-binding protein
MSKYTKILIGVVIVIVLVLLLSGKKNDNGPIKIGFIGPLTGDVSNLGTLSRSAVELATEELIKSGGINGRNVEVIYEDGKCTPVAALNSANKLLNVDRVTAIIGGMCSGETSSFIKNATALNIPVISYCSSAPSLSNYGPMFFRTYPSDSYQGKYAAEYAYNVLKAKKVAVLYHISDWGTGIKDVFVKTFTDLGGVITDIEGSNAEVRDYRSQLTKIKSKNPDYIYMPVYTDGGLIAVQQIQDLGIKAKLLGTDTWSDPKFISSANSSADLTYIGSTNLPSVEFIDKFTKKSK